AAEALARGRRQPPCRHSSSNDTRRTLAKLEVGQTLINLEERSYPMSSIRTILHPTDFSERSEYAFHLACSLARDHGAGLIVLHVVPPPQPTGYDNMVLAPPLSPDYKAQLGDKLRRFKSVDPKLRVDCCLEEGFAADEILRAGQEAKADLIIMG